MALGRPTDYTPELIDVVCSRIAQGESMRSITRDDSMPAMTTMFRWLRECATFRQQYETAKEESADVHADDMLDIADNQVDQPLLVDGIPLMVEGKMVMIKDAVSVNHAKLRIDTRKWAASKLKPKKYGDKIAQEITGKDGGAIEVADMSDREIARRLAFTLTKGSMAPK